MTTITFVTESFAIISIYGSSNIFRDKHGVSGISIHHAIVPEYLSPLSGSWDDTY